MEVSQLWYRFVVQLGETISHFIRILIKLGNSKFLGIWPYGSKCMYIVLPTLLNQADQVV